MGNIDVLIAKVKTGKDPEEPTYYTVDQFIKLQSIAQKNGMVYCNDAAVVWAKGGRIGSRWGTTTKDMFIIVKDRESDIFEYYTPPDRDPTECTVGGGTISQFNYTPKHSGCGSPGGCGDGCNCG